MILYGGNLTAWKRILSTVKSVLTAKSTASQLSSRSRHAPPTTPILFTLPPELLHLIAAQLSAPEAATLALTARTLYTTLGTQYFTPLRGPNASPTERHHFLALLERDLPAHYHCHECAMLHPHRAPPLHTWLLTHRRRARLRHGCRGMDTEAEERLFAGAGIGFHEVRTAMARAASDGGHAAERLGRGGGGRLRRRGPHAFQCGLAFRVVAGRLLMRGRHVLAPGPAPPPLPAERDGAASWPRIYLCPHLTHPGACGRGVLGERLACVLGHMRPGQACDGCAQVRQCGFCATEFAVGVEVGRGGRVCVVVTRWVDLGLGRTPFDPHYRGHMWQRSLVWRDGKPLPLVRVVPGSIRRRFEDGVESGCVS